MTSPVKNDEKKGCHLVIVGRYTYAQRRAAKIKLSMAMQAVVEGLTAADLRAALAKYAERENGTGNLFRLGLSACRQWMSKARKEWSKELATSRLEAYAEAQARLNDLYRQARENDDLWLALKVQMSIIDLEGLAGHRPTYAESVDETALSKQLDRALMELSEAIEQAKSAPKAEC